MAGIILTLGLGIGVNAAMFGIVDRLLLRPPEGVTHPEQVRRILWSGMWFGRQMTMPSLTYSDVVDLRTVPQFASVGAFTRPRPLTLGSGEDAVEVRAVLATADLFPTLGADAELGRVYTANEDAIGAPPTAVLSHEFWSRHFVGDPDILGRTLEISGESYTVVGVMPPGFTGVDLTPVDLWLPAVPARYAMDNSDVFVTSRGYYWLHAVVRVPDEASAKAGSAAASALYVNAREEAGQRRQHDIDTRVSTAPLLAARGPQADATSKVALWLAGVALAVLLIACANVANLLLARGTRRRREIAVRLSLGVTRVRLV
ncbi:MAG: ABC transporter permease, partial [Gemmatimonadota bacterium]